MISQEYFDIQFLNKVINYKVIFLTFVQEKTFKTVGWKRTKWPDKQYLARNIYEGDFLCIPKKYGNMYLLGKENKKGRI